ncbi:Multidrug-efflux transporter [Anaerotruncus sp. 2789STDY5834896]|uniref:Multidrug-efflux transporter n=1 Tax=uncultured Anaerotruncus sp. TaxID=905011 RepID=A0A1C6G4M2_9FIRM|nr:Multidrug-efflux transporter [uncultured Anaerotruncus sp.]
MTKDMTRGNPIKLILLFSIPLLIGNIFQQFYNMADTVIVGRTIGVTALAAVGATGSISFLVLGFVQGLTSGFSVITAQRFGAGDEAGVRRSFATSVLLSIASTAVVTTVSVLGARPLLELMQTPADIIDQSYAYIVCIFFGIGATVFFNLLSGIIRALGDSKTPLIFLIIACIVNIVLDFVLIVNVHMGVAGAAVATVAAQLLSGVCCLVYMFRRFSILKLKKSDWKFDPAFAWEHLRVALPMAFQFSITAIGVVVVQSVLNGFGSTSVAAFTAASKIDQVATQPLLSFGVAMATFTAQNYGAGHFHRIREGVKKCVVVSIAASILGAAVVIIFGGALTRLFVGNAAAEVISLSRTYLTAVSLFYWVLGLLFIFRNTMQGMGRALVPMSAGVTELVLRVVASFTLAKALGYLGVCLASPLAWIGAAVLLCIFYVRTMRTIPNEDEPAPPTTV